MEGTSEDYYLNVRLYLKERIPIHKYDKSGVHIYSIPDQNFNKELFGKNTDMLQKIKRRVVGNNKPLVIVEEMDIFYGAFLDYEENLLLFGPCANKPLTDMQIHSYKKFSGIKDQNFSIDEKNFENLTNILCIAYFFATKQMINEHEVLFEWINDRGKYVASNEEIETYQLNKSELEFQYNSYDFESQYLNAIETGDVEGMLGILQANSQAANKVGMLAKNNKKRMEYMYVSSIALVARAAIRGKMNPNQAYELADIYLQKLERCHSIEEMSQLGYQMQLDFTNKIHDIQSKERREIYVEQCKDYIAKHLRTPFQVSDIAKSIVINPSYLSRKFSEQEGITIQQYIYRERCLKAANMMRYTSYTIAEIAEYLCFSSQSHFGKRFKEYLGETPHKYRKKNKYIETYD